MQSVSWTDGLTSHFKVLRSAKETFSQMHFVGTPLTGIQRPSSDWDCVIKGEGAYVFPICAMVLSQIALCVQELSSQ